MNDNIKGYGYCYGTNSRFFITPFNARTGEFVYMVHDADWVLDHEVREGHHSPTVWCAATKEDAEEWCRFVEEGKITSIPHEANFEGWPELAQRVKEYRHGR